MEDLNIDNIFEQQPVSTPPSKKFKVDKQSIYLVIGGLVIGLLIGVLVSSPAITGAAVSTGDLKVSLAELFPQVTLGEMTDAGNLYQVNFSMTTASGAQDSAFYVTKDGKYLIPGELIDLAVLEEAQATKAKEVPKKDKPTVELFVMSYCPYGLQMEKALLEAQKVLGKSADFSVKFVHYILHGEKEATENTREYCVQKEEPVKFWSYLTCFIKNGENSKDNTAVAESCFTSEGIDKEKINTCMIATTKEFKVDEALASGEQTPAYDVTGAASKAYGVEGSPTLVINGVIADSVGRTPEAVKAAVCAAFNKAPVECDTKISEEGFDAGFGLTTGSSTAATDASCG